MLIVGQDPYPTPGHPVGLSFCVAPDVKPCRAAWSNIYKELTDDLGVPMPSNGDLTPWTRRGVLLLNRCLTVGVGRPEATRARAGEVTEAAIRALNAGVAERHRSRWSPSCGAQCTNLEPLLTNAFIIKSPHPSPLSASRGFFGSKPFSRANEALTRMCEPIDGNCRIRHHTPT